MFQILGILCLYFYNQAIIADGSYIYMKVKFALQCQIVNQYRLDESGLKDKRIGSFQYRELKRNFCFDRGECRGQSQDMEAC